MSSKHSAALTGGSGKPRLIFQIRDAIRVRHYSYRTEQALAAILFLYKHVLEVDLPWVENVVRARRWNWVGSMSFRWRGRRATVTVLAIRHQREDDYQ
jgi:hypothetical protein